MFSENTSVICALFKGITVAFGKWLGISPTAIPYFKTYGPPAASIALPSQVPNSDLNPFRFQINCPQISSTKLILPTQLLSADSLFTRQSSTMRTGTQGSCIWTTDRDKTLDYFHSLLPWFPYLSLPAFHPHKALIMNTVRRQLVSPVTLY